MVSEWMRNCKKLLEQIVVDAQKRDSSIDLLRFVGISLIILAHVSAPEIVLQLRTFDVPMMFFISGLAYSGKVPDFSFQFLWHRIKRLIIPTYIFITAYYLIDILFKAIKGVNDVSIKSIIDSYLLIGGIGYLWVIRVFLMIGILTPTLLFIADKLKNTRLLFVATMIWLSVFSLLITNHFGTEFVIVREFFYYAASYSLLFIWGVRAKKMNDKSLFANIALFLFFFIAVMATFFFVNHGHNYAINRYKYPPCWHFVLYGLFMSILLYLIVRKCRLNRINKWIQLIGSNTIWLYFYHILFVQTFENVNMHWVTRYFAVYILSATVTLLQIFIADYLYSKIKHYHFLKYLKG